MRVLMFVTMWLTAARDRLRQQDPERGDVPGWVMVTVMTAILVVVILGIFEPQLRIALTGIIDRVSNAGK